MDLLADLNDPQRQAVQHIDGPLLLLAGAGSGKTRVITRRVAHLIDQGIAPWNILAITFTNKAAGEMAQRVIALGRPRGATVCTFHSLCARLLREFSDQANLTANYSIYDRNDQIRIVKQSIENLDLPTASFSPARVHSAISSIKTRLQTVAQYADQAGDFYSKNVAKIYRQYEQLLAANNALDFDDLLARMAFLLRDRPEIRKLLCQRYRYVLIDEYQDTNRAQYLIAHSIAFDHKNICATGDPDQSIYGWRGADISNILEFEIDYPSATVIRLEENYRSTKAILAVASNLIACNKNRKSKALWTSRTGGSDVRVVYVDDERGEANQLARRIADKHEKGVPYSGMAVFYRVNALSRVVEEAFIRAGISYQIARGVEFYNRKEVKDVLAYLKALANPTDDLSCKRIINTPARGIGAATIDRLDKLALRAGCSLLEACGRAQEAGLSAGPVKKIATFVKLINQLGQIEGKAVQEIVEDVATKTGLTASLEKMGEEGLQARANIEELISTAAEFDLAGDSDEPRTLAEYLHQISLVSDVDHYDGAAGAVTLMTLHAAKGLEFPVVFIVGCEDGLLPFQRPEEFASPDWDDKLEEERRLAFVGITRAKDEVTLSAAKYRMIRGRTTPQAASKFLTEIGTQGVTVEDLTTPAEAAKSQRSWPKNTSRGGFYEEIDERKLIEAIAEAVPMPDEYEYLRVGSRVRHQKFGLGKIVSLSRPWPDTRAKVQFPGLGTKTLVLSKANLELA